MVLTTNKVAMQDDILGALRNNLHQEIQSHHAGTSRIPAAVICASPRHASWLSDVDFMADVIRELRARRNYTGPQSTKFHLLAAVVDGMPPLVRDGVVQEGMSFLTSDSDRFLPGLWDNTSDSLPDTVAASLCFTRKYSMLYSEKPGFRAGMDHYATLPLANTLFLNGRRSTLLVSEWTITNDGAQDHLSKIKLSRIAEKRNQSIRIHRPTKRTIKLSVWCGVDPICPPRIVKGGLGNIISEIDIEGKVSPASEELQNQIHLWLRKQREQAPTESQPSGPVSVWALVTPRRVVEPEFKPENESVEATERALAKYNELASTTVRFAKHHSWGLNTTILIHHGSRLLRVCKFIQIHSSKNQPSLTKHAQSVSGGGEWGVKAGLLSLDPDIEHESASEAESLESFQSSFHGDPKAAGAIASPGDIIQFFVEPAPVSTQDEEAVALKDCQLQLGVGDASKESELREEQLLQHRNETGSMIHPYFGGYSADGIYLSVPDVGTKTKLGVPGSYIISGLTYGGYK